ncbi:MAG: hypothetical protein E7012_06595 [Alphaproteobacteria bacterium]|nr:hypothetical protein [Alphaproteobacteria bacterium]
MNKIFKQCLTALLLSGVCFAEQSKAEDSVFLNLSVLDNLNSAPISTLSAQEPLFPIVKKAPQIKPAISKKIVKKAKVTPKKEVEPSKSEINVVEAKISEPKIKVEVSDTVVSKPVSAPQIPYVESDEKVVVVDVEPVSSQAEVVSPQAVEKPVEINPEPIKSASSQTVETIPSVNLETEASKPELLIDDNITTTDNSVSTALKFLPDIDELTPEQQKQIDIAISTFKDALNNKIGIYAYNLDDGVDTFKRKRLSLNRAVAVRSYLLPKGYKNFSIKVVNVDSASGKGNTVELEEIKR